MEKNMDNEMETTIRVWGFRGLGFRVWGYYPQ